jgi:hypothetical protein
VRGENKLWEPIIKKHLVGRKEGSLQMQRKSGIAEFNETIFSCSDVACVGQILLADAVGVFATCAAFD